MRAYKMNLKTVLLNSNKTLINLKQIYESKWAFHEFTIYTTTNQFERIKSTKINT